MSAAYRLALCGLLLSAASSAEEVEPPSLARADLRKMAGTYQVTRFEYGGYGFPPATLKTMKVELAKTGDGKFYIDNNPTGSRITVFPGKKPKEIDCIYTDGPAKGKSCKGIYKIDKDGFTCCYAEPGKPRPTEFKSDANSGVTFYVLQRLK